MFKHLNTTLLVVIALYYYTYGSSKFSFASKYGRICTIVLFCTGLSLLICISLITAIGLAALHLQMFGLK